MKSKIWLELNCSEITQIGAVPISFRKNLERLHLINKCDSSHVGSTTPLMLTLVVSFVFGA